MIISVSGPLSGIFRILDSPRAMKRIQDQEKGPREKKVEPKPVTPVAPTQVKTTPVQPARRPPSAARQQSEDDEIARIKRENKAAGSSTTATVTEAERPAERQSILKKTAAEEAAEVSQVPITLTLQQNYLFLAFLKSMTYIKVSFFPVLFLSRDIFLDNADESCNNSTHKQ